MDLKKYIREIPNFPKEGILFKDITPLLAEPAAFDYALKQMSTYIELKQVDAIVAIESRGFIFASPIAQVLNLPFILVRKPGKLPAKTKTVQYSLEYGSGKLEIHEDAIKPGMKVAIVDDLLATGGTAKAASDLITKCGGTVCSYSFLIELEALNGRKLLENIDVQTILSYL